LKQLQLIQILRVKAQPPVNPGFAATKPGCVNPPRCAPDGRSRHKAMPTQPSKVGKSRESPAAALYPAVTLSAIRAVIELNDPGNNGSGIRDGNAYEIKVGDVVVIPARAGHRSPGSRTTSTFIMVDPDKVTPLKSEAQLRDFLSKPAKRGE
jgi:hypothetical protein